MKKKECIYCNSKHIIEKKAFFVPFLVERMFKNNPPQTSVIICKKCKLAYSEYRPKDDEMKLLYNNYRSEEYQKQRQKHEPSYTKEFNERLGFDKNDQIFRKTRLINILKKYINIGSIQSVLDYGGDAGQFIPDEFQLAEKYVYEISNIEPISGIKHIKTKDELSARNYDFIMCSHVLEHVAYPIDIIKEMYSLLKENGYLYIELPIDNSLTKRKKITYIHEHISCYNIKTLAFLHKIFKDIFILDLTEDGKFLSVLIKKQTPDIMQPLKIFLIIQRTKIIKLLRNIKTNFKKLGLLYFIITKL